MTCKTIGIIMLISFVGDTIGANILLLSGIPSPSHLNWHQPLMTTLAKKGHNVTVISSDVEKSPAPNLTYIHIENLYSCTQKVIPQIFGLENSSPFTLLDGINQIYMNCCEHGSKSKGFKQLLNYPKYFKFDVFLSDHIAGPCLISLLMYRFGRPPLITTVPYNGLISSSSFIGSYSYSASIPNHVFDATDRMYFWDRMMNFIYDSYESISKDVYLYPHADRVIKSIFPDAPSTRDLQKNLKLVFTNSNPLIQYKEPLMPMVIPVGGMHILPPKELPEDLHEIVTKSNNGFILFSLGSNVRSDQLDVRRIRGILNVMKAFPQYQFLWKYESDISMEPMAIPPENVFFRAWMPQNDLLAHPNIKLFITHSGLLSTQEAFWNGVPMIGFPLFPDQFRNINYCTSIGVARRLSLETFTEDELKEAIREMVTNPSYTARMKQISQHFRDQPQTPLERAVWWVEWVLRNPDVDVMQSTSALDLWWFQKNLMDVFLFLEVAVIILFVTSIMIVQWISEKCL